MQAQIQSEMQKVTELLIKKNNSYGNSATEPANSFSKGDAVDSISARIDDKIMRIANKGINENTIDTVDDLIGYLVLLKIAWYDRKINRDK